MSKYKTNPIGVCELCNMRLSSQWHHKFSQTKHNKKHYGKLIDEPFNLCRVCMNCHASHANIPHWAKWNESDFRYEANVQNYALPVKMKSCK